MIEAHRIDFNLNPQSLALASATRPRSKNIVERGSVSAIHDWTRKGTGTPRSDSGQAPAGATEQRATPPPRLPHLRLLEATYFVTWPPRCESSTISAVV